MNCESPCKEKINLENYLQKFFRKTILTRLKYVFLIIQKYFRIHQNFLSYKTLKNKKKKKKNLLQKNALHCKQAEPKVLLDFKLYSVK